MDLKTLKQNILCKFCSNTFGTQVKLYTLHLSPGHFFHTHNPEKFQNLKCDVVKCGDFYQVNKQLMIAVDKGITSGAKKYLLEARSFSHYTEPSFVPYVSVQYCCRNDYGRIFNTERNISRTSYKKYYCFLYFISLGEDLKKICNESRKRITKYLVNHFDDFHEFALDVMSDNWQEMLEKKRDKYRWGDAVC